MHKSLFHKVLGVLFLTLLMAWALSYVNDLILERQIRQSEVKQQMAVNSVGKQRITGPILTLTYLEEYYETKSVRGESTADDLRQIKHRDVRKLYVLPQDLKLSGDFKNEHKSLGIYQALMYQLNGSLQGTFHIPANLPLDRANPNSVITWQEAYLSMGIADTRGIVGKPSLAWSNQTASFYQGSKITALGNGIHANLGSIDAGREHIIPFSVQLNLRGTESFDFTPIAENNLVNLKSNWPHPHFNGSFLPDSDSEKIDANGFSAKWSVSSLSSNIQEKITDKLDTNSDTQSLEAISIGFVEPVNIYTESNRATKYGLLFIGLTFAGFFIFEILKQLPIHPAQYTLVGLSMAVFYLLLISFAEHIGFAWAYLLATTACVSLLGFYLTHVLKNRAHGMLFSGLITLLYGALYGILASEDNALLMGSVLVFGLLACTMILTRKIDWYQIGSPAKVQEFSQ